MEVVSEVFKALPRHASGNGLIDWGEATVLLTPFEWFLVGIGCGFAAILGLVLVFRWAIRRFPPPTFDVEQSRRAYVEMNPGLAILIERLGAIELQLKAIETALDGKPERVPVNSIGRD